MIDNALYKVLLAPLVTEKSTMVLERSNSVSFKVATWANKKQVKEAVEKIFNVEVESVKTINQNGKIKRFGRVEGKRSDWKKAMVKLKEGQSIDLMDQGA
uniref:Large ribosomal subunit protein uL23 n=1 Tax=Magnetococcus massalia (strain MO-1) TaxID=451514 RepID=A0A1S7LJ85_MAGMO|nr:50S ribosomal protein L23 [Candidatus Magnetococcus massalia]